MIGLKNILCRNELSDEEESCIKNYAVLSRGVFIILVRTPYLREAKRKQYVRVVACTIIHEVIETCHDLMEHQEELEITMRYSPEGLFAEICGIVAKMALGANPAAATAGSVVKALIAGIQLDEDEKGLKNKIVGTMDAEWENIQKSYNLPEECLADLKQEILGDGTSLGQFVRNFEKNEPTSNGNERLRNSFQLVIKHILAKHENERSWNEKFLSDTASDIAKRIVNTVETVFEKEETLAILTTIARNRTAEKEEHAEIREAVIKTGEHVIEKLGRHPVHSAPISLTTIPMGANLIGREQVIKELRDLLKKYSIVSIRADGGVGKTAVALKIINDFKEEIDTEGCEYKHIGWITSSGNLKSDLTGLDIPFVREQETVDKKISAVYDFLQRNPAFLVIDNLDTLPDAQEIDFLNTLSGKTKVLITTRVSISKLYCYPLKPIDQEASVRLFYKHYLDVPVELGQQELDKRFDWEVVEEIVKKTSGNALLIELIAKMACWEYQDKLEVLWEKIENDIFGTESEIELEVDHNNDIFSETDCKLQGHIRNLYKLSNLDENKQNLMRFISLFPAETVIFINAFKWAGFNINDIKYLTERGWIEKNGEGYLIHTMVKGSVELQNKDNSLDISMYEDLLNHLINTDQYLSKKDGYIKVRERIIVPTTVCRILMESGIEKENVSTFYNNLAFVYEEQGEYGNAIEYYRKALEIREKLLGKAHPDTGMTYNNLAGVYKTQGYYKEALEYFNKARTIFEEKFEKDHPNTGMVYNNLAEVYKAQGDYKNALEYYRKALVNLEKNPEEDTGATSNNLADLYRLQGDYVKALEYFEYSLNVRERVFGKDSPETGVTYNNFALLYSDKGDYGKAFDYNRKALVIFEEKLGKDHPETGLAYNNLALLYSDKGDYLKALEYFKKALEVSKKVFGKEHPSTASTYNNLAFFYSNQGNYEEALKYYNKALAIFEKVYGKNHPETAITYNGIGTLFYHLKDYEKAFEYYEKALEVRETFLGKDHPDTAAVYNNFAVLYSNQGKYGEALSYYRKVLVFREKALGKDHPDTAMTYSGLAMLSHKQRNYREALHYYRKALAVREKVLGKDHPDTAMTYRNLAGVYSAQGDYDKALENLGKAYEIFKNVLGMEHPSTASTKSILDYVNEKLNKQ